MVAAHTLDGKKIDPKHATPKSKSKANKTKKIFVGGVSQVADASFRSLLFCCPRRSDSAYPWRYAVWTDPALVVSM
jgi:hypothetical protein